MAIGTTAAIIGSAVIGAGASYLGSRSQSRAAQNAADTSLAAARENNALARDIYGQNASRLDPYAARGLQAGNALSGLLGLTSAPNGNAPGIPGVGALGGSATGGPVDPAWAQQAATALLPHLQNGANPNRGYHQDYLAYTQANPIKYTADGKIDPTWAVGLWNAVGSSVQANAANNPSRGISQTYGGLPPIAYVQATPTGTSSGVGTGSQTPQQAANAAFDAFRNSTNYQFRFNEGNKALQLSALGGGGFDSGATRKALTEYGQNFAANELGTYMDRLAQQQQFGLGAASALAGVSQNMVSQVSSNNNMGASAAANAALAQGQANANMWSGIGNSIGTAIGALGSSYGR